MPCFNEEEGIAQFIGELQQSFDGLNTFFVIIDDLSTDNTSEQLRIVQAEYTNVEVLINPENVGHGPSTLRGLHHALKNNPQWILAVDGDGQFVGGDLRKSFDLFSRSQSDVLEGIRIGREDPGFRKIITFSLRLLVFLKTRSLPKDANTPFRIYRKETLEQLLPRVNSKSLVPNIEISILTRKLSLTVLENRVLSRNRLGENKTGTTWKSTRDWMPSSRFVRFCINALKQLVRSMSNYNS
jgi:glycosyltransferase involved in cell wall biosynthesis